MIYKTREDYISTVSTTCLGWCIMNVLLYGTSLESHHIMNVLCDKIEEKNSIGSKDKGCH